MFKIKTHYISLTSIICILLLISILIVTTSSKSAPTPAPTVTEKVKPVTPPLDVEYRIVIIKDSNSPSGFIALLYRGDVYIDTIHPDGDCHLSKAIMKDIH